MGYKKAKLFSTVLASIFMLGTVTVFATVSDTNNPGVIDTIRVITSDDMDRNDLSNNVASYLLMRQYFVDSTGLTKKAQLTQETNSNAPVKIEIKQIEAKTYENAAHFKLKKGDLIRFDGFDISKDKDIRLVMAVNDSRFTGNSGLQDFAYSIFSGFNNTYIAGEDGDYFIWIGNQSNKDYKDLTGIVTVTRNRFSPNEIKSLIDDVKKPLVFEGVDMAFDESGNALGSREAGFQVVDYGNVILEREFSRIGRFVESATWFDGRVTPTLAEFGIVEKDFEMISMDRISPSPERRESIQRIIDQYGNHPRTFALVHQLIAYQTSGYYTFQGHRFTIKVTKDVADVLLPEDSIDLMAEIITRLNIATGKLSYRYGGTLFDPSTQAVRSDKRVEFEKILHEIVMEEFELENLNGIEIDLNPVSMDYSSERGERLERRAE